MEVKTKVSKWDLIKLKSFWTAKESINKMKRVCGMGENICRICNQGASCWLSGKESICQCRRHGFDPWSREIPHAEEQLSPYATTTESALWSLGATNTEAHTPRGRAPQQEKPLQWEAHAQQQEKARTQQRRPSTAKNKRIDKQKFFKKKMQPTRD